MTVEISLLLSGISVAAAIFFGISSKNRNDKKDTEQETEDRTATHTLLMTKLENIADDVKDIKRDYRETNAEVQNLRERVVAVEQFIEKLSQETGRGKNRPITGGRETGRNQQHNGGT